MRQDRLVTDRVAALVQRVAAQPPGWADGIPARPEPGPARDRWERDVAVVAAYRDQARIPDDVDPWGARGPVAASEAESSARAAWRRLRSDPGPEAKGGASVNDRLQALLAAPPPSKEAARDRLRAAARHHTDELRRPVPHERGPRL